MIIMAISKTYIIRDYVILTVRYFTYVIVKTIQVLCTQICNAIN